MLRATFGSLLIQKGVSIEHVSLALGHSDIKVTQQWYIGLTSRHVLPEVASGLAKALPR